MNIGSLNTLSMKRINKLIESRELEDYRDIKKIEEFLKSRREYVVKIPKEGSPVILLFSGGLDTTIIAHILLEEFKLTVYPVFIRRNHSFESAEERAADFFTDYFQKRYPGQFKNQIKMTAAFPPNEIKKQYLQKKDTKINNNSEQLWDDPFFSIFHILYAAQYAYTLKLSRNINTKIIFSGFMKCDGERKIDHTLTTLRAIMLSLCTITQDFDWQVISLPLEKELGFFYDKDYFIKWATKHGLPIHKTRSSCLSDDYLQCGHCMVCNLRKFMFKKAEVEDKTKYAGDQEITIGKKIKQLIKNFDLSDHQS